MKKTLTLGFITKENQILLGHKKQGFGEGFWNGFGGKVQQDETIEHALAREIEEETKLTSIKPTHIGTVICEYPHEPLTHEMHIFTIADFEGTPQETTEMKPQWFEHTDLPLSHMWPGDQLWIPHLLKETPFQGTIVYNHENLVVDHFICSQ